MLLNVSGFYLKRPYVFERMVQSAFFCMPACLPKRRSAGAVFSRRVAPALPVNVFPAQVMGGI